MDAAALTAWVSEGQDSYWPHGKRHVGVSLDSVRKIKKNTSTLSSGEVFNVGDLITLWKWLESQEGGCFYRLGAICLSPDPSNLLVKSLWKSVALYEAEPITGTGSLEPLTNPERNGLHSSQHLMSQASLLLVRSLLELSGTLRPGFQARNQ